MPPKPTVTKEEIIEAAYAIIREEGPDALVARNLGKRLNTTPSPIFTFFTGMEEVKEEVRKVVMRQCLDNVKECMYYFPACKEFGLRWIMFAVKEPNLYRFLFFTRNTSLSELREGPGDVFDQITDSISGSYEITKEHAVQFVEQIIICSNGICSMVLNGQNDMTPDVIGRKLSHVCMGMMAVLKTQEGNLNLGKYAEMVQNLDIVPKRIVNS